MTIKGKENSKKILILIFFILMALIFGVYKYINYYMIISSWDSNISKLNEEELLVEKKLEKIKDSIVKYEKEKKKRLKSGLDIKLVKKQINQVLNSFQGVSVSLKSAKHHNNYANLLKVVLIINQTRDIIQNKKNEYTVKRALNLSSVKNYFRVYGDYEFKGNEITFYYLKRTTKAN